MNSTINTAIVGANSTGKGSLAAHHGAFFEPTYGAESHKDQEPVTYDSPSKDIYGMGVDAY